MLLWSSIICRINEIKHKTAEWQWCKYSMQMRHDADNGIFSGAEKRCLVKSTLMPAVESTAAQRVFGITLPWCWHDWPSHAAIVMGRWNRQAIVTRTSPGLSLWPSSSLHTSPAHGKVPTDQRDFLSSVASHTLSHKQDKRVHCIFQDFEFGECQQSLGVNIY